MGASSITTLVNSFHTYFHKGKIEKIGYDEQPFLKWLPKIAKFPNKAYEWPVRFELPEGSHDFATALDGVASSSDAAYRIPRSRHYIIMSLDTESMEAAEDDEDSWIDLKKDEAEGAFQSTTQKLGHALFRNSGGAIGRRASINGNVVTLSNIDDIVFFRKGQRLQASDTDGTSGALRAGTYAIVDKVNRRTGEVTSTTWGNITGFTNNDYLFPAGNFGKGVFGLEAYVPATEPVGGDSFSQTGLDRSVDPTRLAGMRFDGSAMAIEEAILKGLGQFRREGGTGVINALWCNYDRYVEVGLALGSKATRDEAASAALGYDAIRVHAGGKPILLMADHNCQPDTMWALTRETLVFRSLGQVPRFLQRSGGSELIVEPASDGYQMRIGWRGNLIMLQPGKNGRITLPT